MTDYPSINPEDVREGDVVRGDWLTVHGKYVPVQGEAWMTSHAGPAIGDTFVSDLTDLRLVSRPTPPEPPLRVGDFVKGRRAHFEGQIVHVTDLTDHSPYCVGGYWYESDELRRVEPPVGWPVGVPTEDGGTFWWSTTGGNGRYWCHDTNVDDHLTWSELVAAGGVPALAVTR